MIGLLQRVTQAQVTVEKQVIASINHGLLVLVGVEKQDTEQTADRLLTRLLHYRVFADEQGKMNLNIQDCRGELLLVPQFTLAADTQKGSRPSFSSAAPPAQGLALFSYLCEQAGRAHPVVETGDFGATMQVSLINDGPVTFWLQAK
jgi:D-aminoacyl-tRNA deacylase